MKGTFALLGLAATTLARPQGVSQSIAPQEETPEQCQSSAPGEFAITIVNVTQSAKRDLGKRQLDGTLMLTLQDGTLKDQAGRTGYIAANRQFQFDSPPQTGAIYTAGWSLCSNGSLAIGGSAIFYQCLSGDFYNLYDQSQGGQCAAAYMESLGGSGAQATQASDGQPAASTGATSVTQLSDGQPQATSVAVTQISDGQPQASTAAPVSQISDGQPQASTGAAPVSQISDGQPQASTGAAPVSQISDGQPQATTGAAPVTQISDGQPQASTGAAPVTQISDGQPQATTGVAPVTQISDGQIQAPTSTAAVATFTGAADRNLAGSFAAAAAFVGAVAML